MLLIKKENLKMFDETVFNRIAFNLAELTKAVDRLNGNMEKHAKFSEVVTVELEENSSTELLKACEKLSEYHAPNWIPPSSPPSLFKPDVLYGGPYNPATPNCPRQPGIIYGTAARSSEAFRRQ
jgi:hypothetical protein